MLTPVSPQKCRRSARTRRGASTSSPRQGKLGRDGLPKMIKLPRARQLKARESTWNVTFSQDCCTRFLGDDYTASAFHAYSRHIAGTPRENARLAHRLTDGLSRYRILLIKFRYHQGYRHHFTSTISPPHCFINRIMPRAIYGRFCFIADILTAPLYRQCTAIIAMSKPTLHYASMAASPCWHRLAGFERAASRTCLLAAAMLHHFLLYRVIYALLHLLPYHDSPALSPRPYVSPP